MAKEFIVAIELGSSKITGIAGQKNMDGSINILSVVSEDSTACIRKGVVYNIDKTVQCITNIVGSLETNLNTKIAYIYVGVGGQSIRSVKNIIVKELSADTVVSQDMINELMDSNRNIQYPDLQILDAITQEYKVDMQYQLDPVGIQCSKLEGNFLNILWRNTFYRNLGKCLDNAGINPFLHLAPLALADSILTEAEKRGGCILVDLGADTTTVSVYYKNLLRHLAVIPLGGNSITKDISSLQIEEEDAEKMKLKYGNACTDNNDIDVTLKLPIDQDRDIELRNFTEIVEARIDEIIENVLFQIPNEYTDKLLGGVILTGGGSNMKNIDQAFRNITHINKVRIAKFVTQTVTSKREELIKEDGTMNTILGLIAKGDTNCAGEEINNDLFGTMGDGSVVVQTPRSINEISSSGFILTPAEKDKLDQEAQVRREEEERIAQERYEKEREEERNRHKNSTWNKMLRGVKEFGKKMIQEDE